MLEKIESAYLAVMRVVVLIAATIALIVCIVGGTFAAPMLLRQLGFAAGPPQVTGGDLATFVQEQKATQPEAEGAASDATSPAVIPGKIAQAVNILADYAQLHSQITLDRPGLEKFITEKKDQLDPEYQDAYEDSFLKLAQDLKVSKGKPLTGPRLGQLVDWHYSHFQSEILAKKEERLAQAGKASAGMTLAAGGLVAFILILFFFLFVKIERNLRLVRTHEVVAQ
jgi:hypothetical protein